MIPVYNIEVQEGTQFEITFTCKNEAIPALPRDLTGFTATMKVRNTFEGYSHPDHVLAYSSQAPLSGLEITPEQGLVKLTIPGQDTANSTWNKGVYDIILTSADGVKEKLIEGLFLISPSVTR